MNRLVRIVLVVTTLLAAAISLVIEFAVADKPKFFTDDPWRVWFVLGLLLESAIIVGLVGARVPDSPAGPPAIPAFGTGGHSFQAPDVGGRVRGRIGLRVRLRYLTSHGLVVLVGAGGMGKSTLANSAACAIHRRLLRRTHWISFRDGKELAGRMLEVAKQLGLKQERIATAQRSGESLPDLVWHHLDRKVGWTIVLDDVDRADATSPEGDPVAEYRGWIRPSRRGLLLVTSRDREGWGRKARVHQVGSLEPKVAAQVLRDLAPRGGSEEDALRLAHRLGGLPLGLEVAARAINVPMSRYPTFGAYVDALEDRAESLVPGQPEVEDPRGLRRLIGYTWELSLEQLDNESLVLARPLMRLFALCADMPIPRELITPSLLHGMVESEVTAAAVDGAVIGLHRYGLIEADSIENTRMIKIHPVVRESMAALLETEGDVDRGRQSVEAALIALTKKCVDEGPDKWSLAHVLAPHLLVQSQELLSKQVSAETLSISDASHRLGMHLVSATGRRARPVGTRRRILFWKWTAPTTPSHRDSLALCHALADALRDIGKRTESSILHEAILVESAKHLGNADPDTDSCRKCLEAMRAPQPSEMVVPAV